MKPRVSISIDVADMGKAIEFYSIALGCEVKRKGGEISELTAENSTVYLLQKEQGTNPLLSGADTRNYDRHWTPVHLDFVPDNLEETLSRVLEHGGSQEGSSSGDWGSIAFCADPFGNGFCLVALTG